VALGLLTVNELGNPDFLVRYMKKPIVALTMGDPAGIGPEIVVRVVKDRDVRRHCVPVVIGDPAIMQRAAKLVKADVELRSISAIADVNDDPKVTCVLPTGTVKPEDLVPGRLDARYGESAAACCRQAVKLAQRSDVGAIVSAPFNKEAFHQAGYDFMDDMTYFEDCFGQAGKAYMIGVVADLWVTVVTFHVSLRQVPDLITSAAVAEKIHGLSEVMTQAGVEPIKIGVAGLNPHSGEGGLFGTEEIDEIGKAMTRAREKGLDVLGPLPPDSVFLNALDGVFNGVVFMYHDQANIGRKILGRTQSGVTLYVGMPVPVVTVPHGTAFDIAWKGVANPQMLIRATVEAAKLAARPGDA
jgi:4-phospho-D-threonate 3-dehydrogenase / 4-phospho-D-erythronate 3-dehydrogenase